MKRMRDAVEKAYRTWLEHGPNDDRSRAAMVDVFRTLDDETKRRISKEVLG